MKTLTPDQLGWLIGILKAFADKFPSVATLVVMIGLDILSGWLVAISKRTLNSTVSWSGMMRKTMVLLLVSVSIVLEPYANGLPLSMLVSIGFIAQEGLSILENAGALGIPMPQALVEMLEKLQKGRKERMTQKTGANDAMNRLTGAMETRIAQEEEKKVTPQAVIVTEPAEVKIINPPEHPANVTLQK